MQSKGLSDAQVWNEIQDIDIELYEYYLELNELNIYVFAHQFPETEEMERNWNVPTRIEVGG